MQLGGVGARLKSVVQRLVGNASAFQLTLGPFVSVEVELDSPRCIAAYFDEKWAKVLVIDVKVVVVDVDCFVPIELKLAVDFLALKGLGLFLRYSNKDDPIPRAALSPILIGDVIFLFLVRKLMYWNLMALGQAFHGRAKSFRDLSQYHR